MFKKSLIGLIAATTATCCMTVHAASFYMGPSIGIIDTITNNSGYRGIVPKLTFGYGELQEGGYMAGELFVTPTSMPLQDNHVPGTPSSKTTYEIGGSFIPGMVIGPQTVGYARLGFITSKFSGPGTYKTGGQVGIGLMTAVSPNWDVRGEYDYAMYPTVGQLGAPKSDSYHLVFLYRFDGE